MKERKKKKKHGYEQDSVQAEAKARASEHKILGLRKTDANRLLFHSSQMDYHAATIETSMDEAIVGPKVAMAPLNILILLKKSLMLIYFFLFFR